MSATNGSTVLAKLSRTGNDILKCMHCGICTGSCPSGRHMSLNIRRLLRKVRTDRSVLSDDTLWMCTTCYNCQERCPRGIDIVDTILEVREIAVHEGLMLPEHRNVGELLIEHGHAVPIDAENKTKRKALGLNELPPTVHSDPDALAEVKKLLSYCKFDELVLDE